MTRALLRGGSTFTTSASRARRPRLLQELLYLTYGLVCCRILALV